MAESKIRRRSLYAITAAVIVFALTVWPSLYHYESISGGGSTYPVRINRFTGHTEMFDGSEWRGETKDEPRKRKARVGTLLPSQELSKITGHAGFEQYSPHLFSASIYNGSSWIITGLTFRIAVIERDSIVVPSRLYKCDELELEPMSAQKGITVLVDGAWSGRDVSWGIESATGFQK